MPKFELLNEETLDINLNINSDELDTSEEATDEFIDTGEDEIQGEYQYQLTIIEKTGQVTSVAEPGVPDKGKEWEFILEKYIDEEEVEDEFEEMEEIEDELDTSPIETFESYNKLTEEFGMDGEETPSELEPIESSEIDPEEEISSETYRFTEEEIKDFFNSMETEVEIYKDDETRFAIEESIDFLKLYPESKMFVKVQDVPLFEEKLKELKENEGENIEDVSTEIQTVEVGGDNLNPEENKENKSQNNFPMESYSIIRSKGKKNLLDGIYIASLHESKLYGRFSKIDIMGDSVNIDGVLFGTKKNNIKESKNSDNIKFTLKDKNDSSKLMEHIRNNSDVVFKL